MYNSLNTKDKHQILLEQEEWNYIVRKFLPREAKLIWVSARVADSRVFAFDRRIAKIRSFRAYLPESMRTLREEKEILDLIQSNIEYKKMDGWECLIFDRVPGKSLDILGPKMGTHKRLKVLIILLDELKRIHRKGICHTDLRSDNILISDDGKIRIVDFNRAKRGSFWDLTLADWLGISRLGLSENPYWKLLIFTLFPKSKSLAIRVRNLLRFNRKMMPNNPVEHDLQCLERAWLAAKKSRANAPGQHTAYYSLTYKNWHFLGERPWYLRWEYIINNVDFVGKTVLELGCNMGLFSLFAMVQGAEKALGVDKDQEIIKVAEEIGKALHIDASFDCLDLVSDPDWEEKLKGSDIIIAMSLIHWVPNKQRILEFLGHHREVIYEGHEKLSLEMSRLKSIGFYHIKVLCETERGRYVLYGRQFD